MDTRTALVTAASAVAGAVIGITALSRYSTDNEKTQLLDELQRTKSALADAREQLKQLRSSVSMGSLSPDGQESPLARKPVRVYLDGCFDMFHYGHANALRQARTCGDILVVGLIGDAEVTRNKGSPPVMNQEERYAAIRACKWVDEVIQDAPYDLTQEWVDKLVKDHAIDYVVHGDDPCFTADGKDAYAYAKSIGKFKQIKRTEGVSTTDIVGRMLLMTKEHHVPSEEDSARRPGRAGKSVRSSSLASKEEWSEGSDHGVHESRIRHALAHLPATSAKFLPTARRIMQFADGRQPAPGDRVVYVTGGWDLFNAGHVAALEEARKLGDFLLVGIHDDSTINSMRGSGLPILNLYERALSLLSCRAVDEVILGAPWVISEDMVKTMNIAVVARGSNSDIENSPAHGHLGLPWDKDDVAAAMKEAYAVPERLGILRTFVSPRPSLTALSIVERILASRGTYQARYETRAAKEADYLSNHKAYVQEA